MINKKQHYGMELIMDLHDCDPGILASKNKLKEYIIKICKLIKMKRYGKPIIERFGLGMDFTAGYSLVQLIETSSITGHFSEFWKTAYINIFSCVPYDAALAKKFTQKFFGAKRMKARLVIR